MSGARSPTACCSHPTARSCWRRRRRLPTISRKACFHQESRELAEAGSGSTGAQPPISSRRPRGSGHGTTTGDNTMIQMSGLEAKMAAYRQHRRFRDEIEFRRCYKEDIWDPAYPAPTPIARRRVRLEIPERVTAEGEIETPLDEAAVRHATRRLQKLGVRSIAVAFLHFVPEPRARTARGVDPRGVSRRRPGVALARGLSEATRVRADVDHARQRVRRSADRALPRPEPGPVRRFRGKVREL